ncbi:MAG: class I SAM-dependent methyltransferase [Magnetospirillum sp.]|nr:class I SAM-dependent methyltransferase [Magnetospirillum sp.]
MNIADIEGLKFPDEMLTRFFFKNGLHTRRGRVIELGCGNGSNLMLFAAYGWETVGIDYDSALIEAGRRNFAKAGHTGWTLTVGDLNQQQEVEGPFDVFLLPSIIYYFTVEQARAIIQRFAPHAAQSLFYCRFRTPLDYRFGRGEALGPQSFRITATETGEQGCTISFYETHQMLDLMSPFKLRQDSIKVFYEMFDNLQNDRLIRNQDGIIWADNL